MRLAILVAPSDPQSGDASARREALAWLRGKVSRLGFHVVIVGGAEDPEGDLERAFSGVSAGDTALVHVSGRLAGAAALAFGASRAVPLDFVSQGFAARAPAQLSFVAELAYPSGENADSHLAALVDALAGQAPGSVVLAAVRPLDAGIERIAFTRATLPAPNESAGPPPVDVLVSAMHERGIVAPARDTLAQRFTFVRGGDGAHPEPVRPQAESFAEVDESEIEEPVEVPAPAAVAEPFIPAYTPPPPSTPYRPVVGQSPSARPRSYAPPAVAEPYPPAYTPPPPAFPVYAPPPQIAYAAPVAYAAPAAPIEAHEYAEPIEEAYAEPVEDIEDVEPIAHTANLTHVASAASAASAEPIHEIDDEPTRDARGDVAGAYPAFHGEHDAAYADADDLAEADDDADDAEPTQSIDGRPELPPPPLPVSETYAPFATEIAETPYPASQLSPDAGQRSLDRPLDVLILDATEARQWDRVAELRRERVAVLDDPREKARELIALARIQHAELDDAGAAIATLEEARGFDPTRLSVLRALRRGYENTGRWLEALGAIGALAELAGSQAERASLRVAQAHIALEHLRDTDGAASWLHAALEDDPSHAEAQTILAGLGAQQPAPTESGPRERPHGPPTGAWDDVNLAQLEEMAVHAQTQGSLYARAFTLHRRDGNVDGAYLASLALEELDAADVDQQILIDQFRSVGPVRARATLDSAGWELLRAPGWDEVLAYVFASVARPARAVRLDDLRDRRQLPAFDPAERLSETSTASIARSFQWAARVIGIGCPGLYVVDAASGIEAVPAREPTTTFGSAVLRGLAAKDLAFLAGRHLTYYRPEYHVLVDYPTRDELTALLFAAVAVAMPDAPPSPDARIQTLRSRITKLISREERAALGHAVRQLDARGGQASVTGWIRSAELTAARAGLLLCGDLATAAALVRGELRTKGELRVDEKRGDLVAFCASSAHRKLRDRFVVSTPENASASGPPPASSHSMAPPSLRARAG